MPDVVLYVDGKPAGELHVQDIDVEISTDDTAKDSRITLKFWNGDVSYVIGTHVYKPKS